MTLLEVCEPIFQYICRLNRAGRKGATFDFAAVRSEILALFEEAKSRASSEFKLAAQYKEVELPLVFFVDAMISESKLPWARKWSNDRLAFKRDELAGDEKFFDLLDLTLKDQSDEASERLAIYFTCLGLGFTGFYFSQPEYLRQKMQDISLRIRGYVESNSQARICPEAYERTDTRDLIEPPTGRVWLMLVVFLICGITALACNMYFFSKATSGLKDSLKVILDNDPQNAPQAANP